MTQQYKLGVGTHIIQGGITVGTTVPAYSVVYHHIPGGKKRKIAESNVQSGNISLRQLGTGQDLSGVLIEVQTRLNLITVDQSNWPQVVKLLSINYVLDGGQDGLSTFQFDKKDLIQVDQYVFVTQFIQMA